MAGRESLDGHVANRNEGVGRPLSGEVGAMQVRARWTSPVGRVGLGSPAGADVVG